MFNTKVQFITFLPVESSKIKLSLKNIQFVKLYAMHIVDNRQNNRIG